MPDLRISVNLFSFAFLDPLPMLFQYSATALCMRAVHNSIWRAIQFAGTWLFWPPQKRKLFFLSYYTRTGQQLYTSNLPPLFSACTYCVLLIRRLPYVALCSSPAAAAVNDASLSLLSLVGCLPACLTLIYRYFCCAAHSAALCVLCVLFDGLAVHSFVRSFAWFAATALLLVLLPPVCACVYVCLCSTLLLPLPFACLPACLSLAHTSLRLALLCLLCRSRCRCRCRCLCLVQLLQLNFSSVFYRRRSQYILFSVHSVFSTRRGWFSDREWSKHTAKATTREELQLQRQPKQST